MTDKAYRLCVNDFNKMQRGLLNAEKPYNRNKPLLNCLDNDSVCCKQSDKIVGQRVSFGFFQHRLSSRLPCMKITQGPSPSST